MNYNNKHNRLSEFCLLQKNFVFILMFIVCIQIISAQGIIVLEKTAPSTATLVQATQQVVLKPGFHALGSSGNFDAKIGETNSLFPTNMVIGEGSTAMTQNIFVPGIAQNYIKTITYLKEDQSKLLTTFQYFDGLGRPSQTVNTRITALGADMVSMIEYDGVGRENIKWLPAVISGNSGDYVDITTFKKAAVNSNASDSRPYVEALLEASPLNRVIGEKEAGADMGSHQKTIDYGANDGSIAYFYTNSSNQLCKGLNYDAATLLVTHTTDEDGKTAYEFKDKLGQVVLKRNINDGVNVDTYFAYNDLGQQCFVIPPAASDVLVGLTSQLSMPDVITPQTDVNSIALWQLTYHYRYDERGNCIYKHLPGSESIYMVYDLANRLVLSQDGNQRAKSPKQWTVTKYDVLGRILYTGILTSATSHTDFMILLKNKLVTETYDGLATFANTGYTCTGDLTGITPLNVNYYDDYGYISTILTIKQPNIAYQVNSNYDNAYPESATKADNLNAKGQITGLRTYQLEGSGNYTVSAMYYDFKGRIVQTRSTNHLGGYDITYNSYDFMGKPIKTYKTHGINEATDTYTELYTNKYDNAERLLTTTYRLNGGTTVALVSISYDELGRIQTKNIGNIDVTAYTYNIRNWTTGIIGNRFSENLYYNDNIPNLPNFAASYNGNIAGMKWNVASENLGYQRAYSFTYDNLNRLINSVYSGNNGSGTVSNTLDKYTEKLDYKDDKMGNLKALTRYENGALVENLNLSYQGNQLQKADNSLSHFLSYGSELFRDYDKHIVIPKEYAYDTNGNMLYDANGGVSDIEYNVLNLPDKIHFTAGHKNLYTYDAGGQKLRVVNYSSNKILDIPMGTITPLSSTPTDYIVLTTDYVGNMIYENGALKEILLSEGYYQNGTFYYYLKDHLGNNRVTINSSGVVVEKSHYYPSGTRFFTESSSNSTAIPYRYNGKELEAMNGLNQMDYGARRRFSWGPIWTGKDPLAERNYSNSPYIYCSGNPVNRIDPDGKLDMDKKTQKKYPELTKYVKALVNEWRSKSAEFKKAFREKSGLSENQVRGMLIFGKGPKIDVVKDLKDSNGNASNGLTTSTNSFQLDLDAVNMLEKAKTTDDKASGKIMVESIIFHESTHIGNLKVNGKGNGNFNESGQAFEEAAYGQQIETFNVEKFWRSSQPVQPLTSPSIPLLPVEQTMPITTIPIQ